MKVFKKSNNKFFMKQNAELNTREDYVSVMNFFSNTKEHTVNVTFRDIKILFGKQIPNITDVVTVLVAKDFLSMREI